MESSRRQILKFLGGAALVVPLSPWPSLGAQSNAADLAVNGWISIDKDSHTTLTIDKTEMGQEIHVALMQVVADELGVDWEKLSLAPLPDKPHLWHRRLHTGGSRSIRTSVGPIRKASAMVREVLIAAAADDWGVKAEDCDTKNSLVFHKLTGRRLAFGDLVIAAAQLPVPEEPHLRSANTRDARSRSLRRPDVPAKIRGEERYGSDLRLPEMLYAAVKRAPQYGASLLGFDRLKPPHSEPVKAYVPIKARGGCRDGVAVLCATGWHALRARDALSCQWRQISDAAIADNPRKALENAAENTGYIAHIDGNAGTDEGRGPYVAADYYVPYLAHAPMEPMTCTAWLHDGLLELWAPTQTQSDAQRLAAEIAALSLDRVIIHSPHLGGGFGRRLRNDYVAEAVQIALAVEHPIQVTWSRKDDMRFGFFRPAALGKLRASLDGTGRIRDWSAKLIAQSVPAYSGRYDGEGRDHISLRGLYPLDYETGRQRLDHVIASLPVPVHYWRSVAYSHNLFFVESFIDELALARGDDPLSFRLRNIKNPRLKTVLETVAREAQWGRYKGKRGRGQGLAVGMVFETAFAQIIDVEAGGDGHIRPMHVTSAIDCGPVIHRDSIHAQIEGGVIFGLSAALYGEIMFQAATAQQGNFDDYAILRMEEAPTQTISILKSNAPQGGVGEVGTALVAPALCNAVFAASGRRFRDLPLKKR